MRGKRAILAALAAAMLAVAAAAALCLSAPVTRFVEPLPEIETVWEIEDTHALSDEPLLPSLLRDGMPLPRDGQGRFYCPLGLGRGEEWPELKLALPRGKARACFADDYLWDGCGGAIADGTAYRILVWTDEAYCYQEIVFTGLPVVSLSCGVNAEEILDEDIPAELVFLSEREALVSHSRIHRRGGGSFLSDHEKRGYRVELTRGADGKKKIEEEIPGIGEADTFVLLPIKQDATKIRERLGWAIWNRLCAEREPFGQRRVSYCELILNGDYRGVYLCMDPYEAKDELHRASAEAPGTDAVYRTAVRAFLRGRTAVDHPVLLPTVYRVYASPSGHPAAAIAPYTELLTMKDDETFSKAFDARIDADSLIRYELFIQACGLTDNVYNNLYLWISKSGGRTAVRFAPWDLDLSFGMKPEDVGQEYDNWLYYPMADRALNLDCGSLRARLAEKWAEWRAGALSDEAVTELAARFAEELNDSGAMARDAARWQAADWVADPQPLLDFWGMRCAVLDAALAEMTETEGPVDFLSRTQYDEKGGPIWLSDGGGEDWENGREEDWEDDWDE